jgi:hypothetical protein
MPIVYVEKITDAVAGSVAVIQPFLPKRVARQDVQLTTNRSFREAGHRQIDVTL